MATQLSLPRAVSAIVFFASVAAGVAWTIQGEHVDQLKDELAAFQSAKDWTLPQTLKDLNKISEQVRLQLEDTQRLKTLADTDAALSEQNEQLKSRLSALQQKVSSLEATNKAFVTKAQDFNLAKGESGELVKNTLMFGVEDIESMFVLVNVGSESYNLSVGQSVDIPYDDQHCFIRLKSLKPDSATFSAGCL